MRGVENGYKSDVYSHFQRFAWFHREHRAQLSKRARCSSFIFSRRFLRNTGSHFSARCSTAKGLQRRRDKSDVTAIKFFLTALSCPHVIAMIKTVAHDKAASGGNAMTSPGRSDGCRALCARSLPSKRS